MLKTSPQLPLILLFVFCGLLPNSAHSEDPESAEKKFTADELAFYENKVQPLLRARCLECHGADVKEPKGGLYLESRDDVLKGGESGPAAVSGKPDESLLVEAIRYEGFEMPPRSKMPDGEIAILTKWVKMGMPFSKERTATHQPAAFPLQQRRASHWAWQAVKKPPVPQVKDNGFATDDIDRFIVARAAEKQLVQAPPASRRTLIRRAFFALIGLPPSPDQVDAFVNDSASDRDAFAKVIDELLASPHFGERWGRHWLDLMRYAESLGHEFDYPLHHATGYRDYVIRALNADVPYNQFVMEHIAGDLLANPRRSPDDFNESIIGTGFWFLGEDKHAPVDVRGEEASKIDNQIDVFSKTFLGLTVACARCHDHKFDAISTADYYALSGYLQSSRRQTAYLDPGRKIENGLNAIQKKHAAASNRLAKSAGEIPANAMENMLRATAAVAAGQPVDAAAKKFQVGNDLLQKWVNALKDEATSKPDSPLFAWTQLSNQKDAAFQKRKQQLSNQHNKTVADTDRHLAGTELFDDFSNGFQDWYPTGFAFAKQPTHPFEPDIYQANTLLSPGLAHSGRYGRRLRGALRSKTFVLNHKHILYRVAGDRAKIRLIIDGYEMNEFNALLFAGAKIDVKTDGKFQWIRQGGDIGRYQGHRVHIEFIDDGDGWIAIDEIRFQNDGPKPLNKPNAITTAIVKSAAVNSVDTLAAEYGRQWSAAQQDSASAPSQALAEWVVKHGLLPAADAYATAVAELKKQADQLPHPQSALAICDGSPEDEYVFIRGDHRNKGPFVGRRLLTAISGDKQPTANTGSGRLDLARRVTDPANPFVSRVIVNRIWHHLIGRGIVASTDNFGVLGQRPTHPELLDHLAVRFMENGWSIKRMIRDIMLSSTYRMASEPSPSATETDPENLLLSHANIKRLESEAIRDSLLTISGRLDRKLFGPSVPVFLTSHMQGRGRPRRNGPLDGSGRRSIYIAINRNFLSPTMLAFDTPIPFTSIGRRTVSNVPAQALILMNDPFVLQQSKLWAEKSLQENASPEDRIATLYQTAYARAPQDVEVTNATRFLESQARSKNISDWHQNPEVWADLCHVLVNVKEFIFLN